MLSCRRNIRARVVLGLLATAGVLSMASQVVAQNKPNIVLFVVDDAGFQLGCYGDNVAKTPNIDALAAQGTRFQNAFCTTASCSASRSVILTGLINHANGQFGHAHAFHHFSTHNYIKSLPVILSKAGYRTCSIGKYHVAPEKIYHFDEYRNAGSQNHRNTVRMAQNAKEFIAKPDERPFFLYFCTTDPHRGAGPGLFSNFNNVPNKYPGVEQILFEPKKIQVPSWLPNKPEVHKELAEYYQAINRLDQGLGVLLNALKETGHADDTLILFLSDNGPPFPGAKTTLYEPGMHLPLIVCKPGQKRRGITTDAMVTWADLTPTILDYCGVKAPNPLHGRSFLPVLEKEKTTGWDEAYASHTFHEITMYYPTRVIRSRQYKYLLNLAHQLPYPFASDLYESPTWQGTLKRGDKFYGKRTVNAYLQRPRHELYDLKADPHELNNLANSEAHTKTLTDLQTKLKAWQVRTDDPWIVKYKYE